MTRPTLKDVAARAGVSYQTVSKVLNRQGKVTEETEARILQAARDLNYRPNASARSLRTRNSGLIGYAWQRAVDETPRPILDQFLYHAALAFEDAGYHLLTFLVGAPGDYDFRAYQELYDRQRVDGIMLADTNSDDPRIAFLIEQGIPFASFGRANDDWDFSWVDVDGTHGMRIAVEHLLERGHERIGLLTWPEGSEAGSHREDGYLQALAQAGISADPAWMVRGENSVQHGSRSLRQLLELSPERRPTGVACVSDQIAVGAVNAAQVSGLEVGRDLAVTGYDDSPVAAYLQPPLTSVRQPISEVGSELARLVLEQVDEDRPTHQGVLLLPELMVRASSDFRL